jgi:diguanylate cyclase (GGDEF)-like protein
VHGARGVGVGEQPQVQALAQVRDGSLWAAAAGTLWQFGPGDGATRPPPLRRRIDAAAARVYRLVPAADGGLWLCGFDGLYHLAPGAARPRRLARADGTALQTEVLAAAYGPDGALWVGTAVGLYRVPAGRAELHPVPADPAAELAHPAVTGLLWDAAGRLWLDTAVAGLHRLLAWDGRQARFDRIGERLGALGRPFGVNLMADAQGRIWTHLHVYDPAADRLDALTAADGQHLGTGWFHSHAALADGRLLFGGARGLLVVEPARHAPPRDWPPLVLSELRVDDQPLRATPATLVLRPGQSRFSAEFAALEYGEPGRIRYAWRLGGLDEGWVEAGADHRAATFAYLPPGRYTLEARASNRAGQWGDAVLALPVEVQPKWWQRDAVRGSALLLLALAAAALLQWRTAALRHRKAALEALVHERTAALEATTQELQRETDAAREASLTDPLTGLRNRRHLLQHIDGDVAATLRRFDEATRHGLPPPEDADLLFFIVDVDHFKRVNDLHGHAAGDAVLRQFRSRLAAVFRDADHLVRWGGEEFLVVARGAQRAHAEALAERARCAVADTPFQLDDGRALRCSCSIGFAALPLSPAHPRALGWEDTVSLADAALYRVKDARRDGWAGVVDAGPLDAAALARLKADGWPQALAGGALRVTMGASE